MDDPYVWRDPLSERLAVCVTDGKITGQAVLHWPDEVDLLIEMIQANKPFLRSA